MSKKDLPIDVTKLTKSEKVELLETLTELDERLRYNKLSTWFPDSGKFARKFYPKQVAFMNAGAGYKERCLFGANRSGKSTVGALEMTYHLTGQYPDWWKGKRFDTAVEAWAAGDSHITVRDIAQFILLGSPLDMGTGMIPKNLILNTKTKTGIPNAISDAWIQHVSGGISHIGFKSYEQGRKSFQGTAQHVIWLDEECPEDVYSECLTRTMTTKGVIYLTFTPLEGLTRTVQKFLPGGQFPVGNIVVDEAGMSRYIERIEWQDAHHLSEKDKTMLLASYNEAEREARSMGIPYIGEKKIYPILESEFVINPFQLSPLWPRAYGLDVGYGCTAAIWAAVDPNTGTIYLYDEYYGKKQLPAINAHCIRARGSWISGAIDPSSSKGSVRDGQALIEEYRDLELDVHPANNTVEPGILAIINLLSSGRLKVFRTLHNWLSEYRIYRRDDSGRPARNQADHLMDATRYLIMTGLEFADIHPEDRQDDHPMSYFHDSGRDDITGY